MERDVYVSVLQRGYRGRSLVNEGALERIVSIMEVDVARAPTQLKACSALYWLCSSGTQDEPLMPGMDGLIVCWSFLGNNESIEWLLPPSSKHARRCTGYALAAHRMNRLCLVGTGDDGLIVC